MNARDALQAPLCELDPAFVPCEFRVKWADGDWERAQAQALRRAVFCVEQGVFVGDDADTIDADAHARTLVALSMLGGAPDQVVGTVRIHPAEDGLWWGSRLAVHAAFRRCGRLGATLIELAVRSARGRGASCFLAHVQAQNLELFRRLHWRPLRAETLHGRPHYLMQADLAHYPPHLDPTTGIVVPSKRCPAP